MRMFCVVSLLAVLMSLREEYKPIDIDTSSCPDRYHETLQDEDVERSQNELGLAAEVLSAFEAAGLDIPLQDVNISAACGQICKVLDCHSLDSADAFDAQVIQYLLRRFGVTDSFYFPVVAYVDDAEEGAGTMRRFITEELGGTGVNRFGLAWDEGGTGVMAAVFTRRLVQLGPFPIAAKPGSTHLLWGSLVGAAHDPLFVLSTPGEAMLQRIPHLSNDMFWTEVYFPEEAGQYTIEVVAHEDGPHVASLFPVFVGTPVPPRPVLKVYPGIEEGAPARSLEVQVFELVNKEREKRGLPRLKWSKELAASALEHSRAMAKAGRMSHVVGKPAHTGLRYTENISLSTSLSTAHSNLMGSPTHRQNILDPEMTLSGIGIEPVVKKGGTRLLFMTQRFGRKNQ